MVISVQKRTLAFAVVLFSGGVLSASPGAAADKFSLACSGDDVMVGVSGSNGQSLASIEPVCATTEGAGWTSPTYAGPSAGSAGASSFSSICSAGQAVRSLSTRSGSGVEQLTVGCQSLSETGGFVGPVTLLQPVGASEAKEAVDTCAADKPAFRLAGAVGSTVASLKLDCRKAPKEPPPKPEGLKGVEIPTPSNLDDFVADRTAAVALGKALFWDMQVGSDGVQACASCHFHAGTDNRSKNALNPGLDRASSPTTAWPDTTFQVGGPNYQLTANDFPFFQREKPDDPHSRITRDINDVVSSQGVFLSRLLEAPRGQARDKVAFANDDLFNVGLLNTRRVAGRNTPTTINAVFNFRNFWDGRAQFIFNGVNPFGARDESARVFKKIGGMVTPVKVRIDNASLASQAVGPPSSIFEMSADGRTLMDIGKRLLSARPLALQRVAPDGSVLGGMASQSVPGLTVENYATMVKAAFRPQWWSGAQAIEVLANGEKKVTDGGGASAHLYSQMEANFSLFFGLAIQMYESTLVSDDSAFDRYMAGDSSVLNKDAREGMDLFFGKAKCANCHGGAEFTNASTRKTLKSPLQRMVMGNDETAVYDQGFYNIAVTRTSDDILVGGRDAFGRPLSNAGLAQQVGENAFRRLAGVSANLTVAPGERIAVMGAAKTPTIRNAELTQPFFHNGGVLNLGQLLEFYNRGGNFADFNANDVDTDIRRLGLSSKEKEKIMAFVKSLTDDRVRREAAPFDHPELTIPNGHKGDSTNVRAENGRAADLFITLPAVGASGGHNSPAQRNFLGVVE